MKRSKDRHYISRDYGVTFVEILVVLSIVAILSAIVFFVSRSAIESAKQTACISQLSQIYKGLVLYSSDNDATSLYPELHGLSYVGSQGYKFDPYIDPSILICPTVPSAYRPKHAGGSTYASGLFFPPVSKDGNPSQVRKVMIQQEKAVKGKLVVMECTAHDEFFYAPGEKDVDPSVAKPFKCLLHADGSTLKGRTSGPRDFPLTRGQ